MAVRIAVDKRYLYLGMIVLLGILLRLYFFSGYVGFDDKHYILQSYAYSQGKFQSGEHNWGVRIGMNLPASLFLKIFGISQFSFILFPLLCSLANILLAYYISNLLFKNVTAALFSAFVVSMIPLEIIYATLLYADIPLGTMLGLTTLLFLRAEAKTKNYLYYLSGLCLGFSYLMKLTAFVMIPVMCFYLIYKRKLKPNYGFIILGFLTVIAFELTFHHVNNGDAFYRIKVLQEVVVPYPEAKGGGVNSPIKTGNYIIDRFIMEPFSTLFLSQEFGLFFYLVIVSTVFYFKNRSESTNIVLIWFLTMLIIWSGAVLKSRISLYANARVLSILFIPGALLAGKFLFDALKRPLLRYAIMGILCLSALFGVFLDASRYDKQFVEEAYRFYQNHPDEILIVAPNDYVGLLFLSNFTLKDNLHLFYPNVERKSGTEKSIRLVKSDIVGYYSLDDWNWQLKGAYVSVPDKYIKREAKEVVSVLENKKTALRDKVIGAFVEGLGLHVYYPNLEQTRKIYHLK